MKEENNTAEDLTSKEEPVVKAVPPRMSKEAIDKYFEVLSKDTSSLSDTESRIERALRQTVVDKRQFEDMHLQLEEQLAKVKNQLLAANSRIVTLQGILVNEEESRRSTIS